MRPRPLCAAVLVSGCAAVLMSGCAAGYQPPSSPLRQVVQIAATTPSPDPSARAGGLVEGFPAVVPVPPGGHVTASAVQSRGDLLAVSATGTSPMPVTALLAWFRTRLRAEGFTATDDTLLPKGAAGAAYGRPGGVELLVVAVVDRGSQRSWSVGGTVAPRRDRG